MPGGKIAFFTGLLDQAEADRRRGRHRDGPRDRACVARAWARADGERHAAAAWARQSVRPYSGLKDYGRQAVGAGAQLCDAASSRATTKPKPTWSGLDLVARAGYDPRAGVALWRKMGMLDKNSPPQWLTDAPGRQQPDRGNTEAFAGGDAAVCARQGRGARCAGTLSQQCERDRPGPVDRAVFYSAYSMVSGAWSEKRWSL